MIDSIITGKVADTPKARQTKSGGTFVTLRLQVSDGENRHFANCICFREAVCDQLLALSTGDSVAVGGSLKVGTWTDKQGQAKPSLDVTVETAMTIYSLAKKRKASQPEQQQGRAPAPADDGDFLDVGQPL